MIIFFKGLFIRNNEKKPVKGIEFYASFANFKTSITFVIFKSNINYIKLYKKMNSYLENFYQVTPLCEINVTFKRRTFTAQDLCIHEKKEK